MILVVAGYTYWNIYLLISNKSINERNRSAGHFTSLAPSSSRKSRHMRSYELESVLPSVERRALLFEGHGRTLLVAFNQSFHILTYSARW
jgi:hypothetical protein